MLGCADFIAYKTMKVLCAGRNSMHLEAEICPTDFFFREKRECSAILGGSSELQ
jgi:hypothetical protein